MQSPPWGAPSGIYLKKGSVQVPESRAQKEGPSQTGTCCTSLDLTNHVWASRSSGKAGDALRGQERKQLPLEAAPRLGRKVSVGHHTPPDRLVAYDRLALCFFSSAPEGLV